MPRLRRRWCKSVIDSVHHCNSNLPQIWNRVKWQPVRDLNFSCRIENPASQPLKERAVKLAPVTGIEPANQCLERASAKPA